MTTDAEARSIITKKRAADTKFVNSINAMVAVPFGSKPGTGRRNCCHTNVLRRKGTQIWAGYIVFKDHSPFQKIGSKPPYHEWWTSAEHSFNVVDGKVVEHTPVDVEEVHYFGVPVPKSELKGFAYLKKLKSVRWIKQCLKNSETSSMTLSRMLYSLLETAVERGEEQPNNGFGAGCLVLSRSTGRFMLQHRSPKVDEPNTWGTWGGSAEDSESPKQTLMRELEEETGYKGPFERIVPLHIHKDDDYSYHNFLVIVPEEFTPRTNHETRDADWFTYDGWPEPLHYGLHEVLDDKDDVKIIKQWIGKCEQSEETAAGNEEANMPWTAKEFREKHCHDLSDAQAKKAADIANAILRSGGEDGVAISTGIKKARELASKVPMYARLNCLLKE